MDSKRYFEDFGVDLYVQEEGIFWDRLRLWRSKETLCGSGCEELKPI